MITALPSDDRNESDATDLALVTSYQRGNGNALSELYRRHGRRVESVARNLLGPSSELEDVVQDVFIELQKALFKFRGESRFTTWLHRITVNVTLMYLRRGRRKGWLRWVGLDEAVSSTRATSSLEGRIEARDLCRQLYDILAELPEKKYVVFALYELEGMSLEEIASTLDIGINTVKSRLFHARKDVFEAARERGALPAHALQVVK
jgi:RNA polymerase sigma-70 factor (ECF subfamily)